MPPPERPDESSEDWIDRLTLLAGKLGMSEVRVRWKLMAWRDAWHRKWQRSGEALRHAGYEHKICPACAAVNDREFEVCSICGASLLPHRLQVLLRLLGLGGEVLCMTTVLITLMVVVYGRQILASPENWLASASIRSLLELGGHYPPYVAAGEWWRLGTAVFLHIGVWHLAFNALALFYLGPPVEKAFGSGRMIFLFMVTGVGANLGTQLHGLEGVSAGASGAICGLVGLAAGFGHREGTSRGRELRDQMLGWGLLTLAFGWFMGGNNSAHAIGFALGACLGLSMEPSWHQRGASRADLAMGATGLLVAVLCCGLILFPPRTAAETGKAVLRHRLESDATFAIWMQNQEELRTGLPELDRQEASRVGLVCAMCSVRAVETLESIRFFGDSEAAICSSCLLLDREQLGKPGPSASLPGNSSLPGTAISSSPASPKGVKYPGEPEVRCSFCRERIPEDGPWRVIQGRAAYLCERCAFR